MLTEIKRDKYTAVLYEPELYIDNKAKGRSGHMSHAMAEFAPDRVIDFNSNCSPVRLRGHSAFGWIEYRILSDCGKSFSEVFELPYSKQAFLDGVFTVSVEKAVACNNSRIIAFCLRNTTLHEVCCEPWLTPTVIYSDDGGRNWSEPYEFSPDRGRIYDALYHDGVIYVLQFCNDGELHFTGRLPEHRYRLYASYDNGLSFSEVCVIPLKTEGRGYGSMLFSPDGNLRVYTYNINSEREMDYIVSGDLGKSWSAPGICYLEKGIRNPQTSLFDGVYILHGRGEKDKGFVLYTSEDGEHWDDGEYLEREKRLCYYSNNIILRDSDGTDVLLIQYSDAYEEARVNVMHMRLKIKHRQEKGYV